MSLTMTWVPKTLITLKGKPILSRLPHHGTVARQIPFKGSKYIYSELSKAIAFFL